MKTTEKEKSLGTFPPVSLIYGVLLIPLNRQFAKHKFQIQIVKPPNCKREENCALKDRSELVNGSAVLIVKKNKENKEHL